MFETFAFRRPVAALLSSAVFAFTSLALPDTSSAQNTSGRLTPDRIAESIVQIRTQVPPDAPSARRLGTTREGGGTVIRLDGVPDGHVLTIGYLITDAATIEITDHRGRKRAAEVVGQDHASGLGLVRLSGGTDLPGLDIGDSSGLRARAPVIIGDGGGVKGLQPAIVASVRPFAASREYMLDRAIYASPPIERFGGAPLLGGDGKLVGVGSLIVNDAAPGQTLPGNMFVPADLLKSVAREIVASGRPKASRPWLGLNAEELTKDGVLIVGNVTRDGPAAKAGLKRGDVIYGLGKGQIKGLADFYRKLWSLGEPGIDVTLKVMQSDGTRDLTVKSDDRYKRILSQPTY